MTAADLDSIDRRQSSLIRLTSAPAQRNDATQLPRCPFATAQGPSLRAVRSRFGLSGHRDIERLISGAPARHLGDRAPVLRCYGCAILAPSQQVRPGDR